MDTPSIACRDVGYASLQTGMSNRLSQQFKQIPSGSTSYQCPSHQVFGCGGVRLDIDSIH